MAGFVLFLEATALVLGAWYASLYALPRYIADRARHELRLIELDVLLLVAEGRLEPSRNVQALLHYLRHVRQIKGTLVDGLAAYVLMPGLDRRSIDQRVLKGAKSAELEILSSRLERAKRQVAFLGMTSSVPSVFAVYPIALAAIVQHRRSSHARDGVVTTSAQHAVDKAVVAQDKSRQVARSDFLAVA